MVLRRPTEIGRQWGRGSLWSECIMPNLYRETPITLDAEKRSETGKRSGQTAPTGGRAGSVLSCPRFLWTPYCPEKLEDDSVEGNGKTMIDAAGLVGSEGERGSSMLSITGQAAGAGPLAPGQRWSLARKHEGVLGLLRGEPVEAVSRQVGVPVWQLERWQARALAGLKTGLRERSEDPAERELAEAHRRIGELSREVELLRARIERPGPLARRRSR